MGGSASPTAFENRLLRICRLRVEATYSLTEIGYFEELAPWVAQLVFVPDNVGIFGDVASRGHGAVEAGFIP